MSNQNNNANNNHYLDSKIEERKKWGKKTTIIEYHIQTVTIYSAKSTMKSY